MEWKFQISVGVCNGWNGRFRCLLECVMFGMEHQISVGECNVWNGRFRYLLVCVMVGMEGSVICWTV